MTDFSHARRPHQSVSAFLLLPVVIYYLYDPIMPRVCRQLKAKVMALSPANPTSPWSIRAALLTSDTLDVVGAKDLRAQPGAFDRAHAARASR
jgi:hypothetical protein